MSTEAAPTSDAMRRPQRFYGVAALAIVVLGLLFALYVLHDRRSLVSDGERVAAQIAEETALIAEGTLDATRQLLRALAFLARPPVPDRTPEPGAVRAALLDLKAQTSYIMDLLIVDPRGHIQHWTGQGTPPDVSDREYYIHHATRASSGLFISEPLLSKVHQGQWFFALSEALRDRQGRLIGVVVAIVDSALLHERMALRLAVPGTTQALISDSGAVHARLPDHATHVGKRVVRPSQLAGLGPGSPSTTIRSPSQLDGRDRILCFRKVAAYPLIAVGTVVVDEILVPWRQRALLLSLLWVVLSAAALGLARRATAISRAQAELAEIDSLTGIDNRRAILDKATQLERSQAHAGSLSLLMIDVDHFKTINDRFGHQVGDEVLRRISDVLRTQIRATDIVGRYGGEEFLVLMPDTGPDGALLVAQKLCQAMPERIVQPMPVTISIGVATTSEKDATLDRTLTRADRALYRAKAEGRNCVRVAESGPDAG